MCSYAGRWAWSSLTPTTTRTAYAAVVALHRFDPGFRFFLVHSTDGDGGAMQEHRTQRNDMNTPEATEDQRVKGVSRATEVIAWPPTRPGRVLRDIFDGV